MTERFFAPCPRGLENVLAAELAALGAREALSADGGVGFRGPFELCYRVNLESRVASRVLWQVGRGSYRDEADIYRAALALDWPRWFDVGCTLRVNLSAIKSPLRSLDFATLRIKDGVCDRFREHGGSRPSVDTENPDVRIHAFLTAQAYTLYLDTSGEALFKRGYRRAAGEAPLRENLAAGILRLADWAPDQPLLDPVCGSGTFLIEAAHIAQDRAPGLARRFGFEKLKRHDAPSWAKLLDAARSRVKHDAAPRIQGGDLYGDVLKLARANLEAADVAQCVILKQVNALETAAPYDGGVLVANPPYGVRLGDEDELADFYPRLGDVLKQRFAGWRAYVLSPDLQLQKKIRLAPSKRTPLFNGGIECRLYEFKMVAGGLRRPPKTESTTPQTPE